MVNIILSACVCTVICISVSRYKNCTVLSPDKSVKNSSYLV
jgi:hypothetical protein